MYEDAMTLPTGDFTIPCTGDAVTGDKVRFTEAVFAGSRRNPTFVGTRTIEAEITRDSYGADKQQHTFSMTVIAADGEQAPDSGARIRRKGRNLYRNGTYRAAWADEEQRLAAVAEKHGRGDAARADRQQRKEKIW